MRNLFSYDNKIMQMLMVIGDMIILNVLFLFTCLPLPLLAIYLGQLFSMELLDFAFLAMLVLSLFPMGAAQAGLYTAAKVMMDKEDDSSLVKAYFRGLTSGFGKIAIANTAMLALIVVCVVAVLNNFVLQAAGSGGKFGLPLIFSFLALFIAISFQSVMPLFHSRFGCTVFQLFRNSAYIFLLHPIRSVGVAVLTWLPLLIALLNLNVFVALTPLMLALTIALGHLFAYAFMRKPLDQMVANFYERNGLEDPNKPTAEEAEAEEADD